MVTSLEDRVTSLELELHALSDRLSQVERATASVAPTPRVATASPLPPIVRPRPAQTPAPVAAPAVRRKVDVEELLGGRLLALVGGLAVVIGLIFLVALAIDRGWIDERLRVTLALVGSGALAAGCAWLYERRGKTQAALAGVAAGIAGLFLSLTAATSLYDLLPVPLGLAGALATGALGVVLALRWDSRTIAGLGILGALASPALLDATESLTTLGFLAVALAAAAAILTWKQWEWLRIAAFAIAMLQVGAWALMDSPGLVSLAAVLALFGVLNLVAALGYEIRVPTTTLRASTSLLVGANALIAGGIGYAVMVDDRSVRAAGVWVAAVSLAHLAAGLVALTLRRVSRPVGLLLLGVALVLGDIAFALLVDGAALAVGWAFSALALAVLARRGGQESGVVQGTLAGQLTLAIAHTLLFDAPVEALGEDASVSYGPLVAIVVSAFACARLAKDGEGRWRIVADAAAVAALAYTTALALDGPALVVAWVVQGVALLPIARRTGDDLAASGVFVFLGLALGHAVMYEARPDALVDGVESLPDAALALAAVVGGAIVVARARLGWASVPSHLIWLGAGAAAVYLASIGIVDSFQSGEGAYGGLDAGDRQQGQAVLSAFWGVVGLGLLWLGLSRDERAVRLAGFGLLAIAVGKVFIFDMSSLDSGYRVLTFILLGLLLLAGAFAYQRMRRQASAPSRSS